MKSLISVAAVLMALGIGPLLVVAGLPPADHGLVLAIIPPWRDSGSIIAAAGGRVVGPSRAPFAVFAFSDRAGFAAALRDGGAYLAIDAQRLAALCGV